MKIFHVDDEKEVLKSVATVLHRMGHFVESIDNLVDSLLDVQDFDYDLIILDLDIQDGAGGESVQKLLDMSKPDTPIIYYSGNIDDSVMRKYLSETRNVRSEDNHGGIWFVTKGYNSINELIDIVEEIENKEN